jgi:hypothetical protein
MKIKRLGIEWGAAHEEAQPVKIKHGAAEFICFISENGEMVVQVPDTAEITHGGRVFELRF